MVLSKFLYLIANWSSHLKPVMEILAILKSALKLRITSFQYGQQMAFLENQIIFKSSVCPLVSMATNLHFDILIQHRTFKFMVFFHRFFHNHFENFIKDHKNDFNILLLFVLAMEHTLLQIFGTKFCFWETCMIPLFRISVQLNVEPLMALAICNS